MRDSGAKSTEENEKLKLGQPEIRVRLGSTARRIGTPSGYVPAAGAARAGNATGIAAPTDLAQADRRLLALDEALERFTQAHPRKAELVRLRYFAGLSHEEAAAALGIAVPTAKQWWAYAKAWLYQAIGP